FFCDNDECHQRIFCERLPEVVAPYGRQTIRFNRSLTAVGFALGGRAGERLASDLYLHSGARTLLRRIYNEPLSKTERVRILGVDDFAFRKGQRYGTILVDLERHRVIDLLPDREGSTLEGWLKSHPEVELIARDRALAYADGATKGAPQAVQVVDRFHLIKNLVEAFEVLARRHSSAIREAALEVSPRRQTEMMLLAEGCWKRYRSGCRRNRPHHRRDVIRTGLTVWSGMKNAGDSSDSGCPTTRLRAEPACAERQ